MWGGKRAAQSHDQIISPNPKGAEKFVFLLSLGISRKVVERENCVSTGQIRHGKHNNISAALWAKASLYWLFTLVTKPTVGILVHHIHHTEPFTPLITS